jgi:anti-sigma B factor antagonist
MPRYDLLLVLIVLLTLTFDFTNGFNDLPKAIATVVSTRIMRFPVAVLMAGGQKNLILDMSDVAYISSSGLRVLMVALKATRAAQGNTRLVGVNRTVREVIKMTGFDTLFQIYPDIDSALVKFAMDINETKIAGAMVINLRGDMETTIAPDLIERLRALFSRAPGRAVLNLAGVNYASVEGLRAMQEVQKSASELKVDLRLAGVEKALKESFDLKGITPLFQIFPKVEAAVASFPKR